MGPAALNLSLTSLQAPVTRAHRDVLGLLPHETPPLSKGSSGALNSCSE